jgi:EAL domain-containing protein (putative c-di-GMP-specific phosphodiesterase class I)
MTRFMIAEGIETKDELVSLQDLGVTLFQGYLFAKPAFEELPVVNFG